MRDLYRLATKNIAGSSFRSAVVLLCALVVTGLAVSTLLIVRGAQQSLQLAMDRLGADIIVVPEGAETKVESALSDGRSHPGVDAGKRAGPDFGDRRRRESDATALSFQPQERLLLRGLRYVHGGYDPATDFTVEPWLESRLGGGLGLGEAVGGTHVFVPEGEQNIKLYGYFVTLRGNMEPTGYA